MSQTHPATPMLFQFPVIGAGKSGDRPNAGDWKRSSGVGAGSWCAQRYQAAPPAITTASSAAANSIGAAAAKDARQDESGIWMGSLSSD